MRRLSLLCALLALVGGCDEADEIPTPCRQVVECSMETGEAVSPQTTRSDDGYMASDNACAQEVIEDLGLHEWGRARALGGYVETQMSSARHVLSCTGLLDGPCGDPAGVEMACDDTTHIRYLDDGTTEPYTIWPWED